MNYYPEQLEQIAKLCRALNTVDAQDETNIVLAQNLPVVDCRDEQQTPIGYLVDEIGGAWSFKPIEGAE